MRQSTLGLTAGFALAANAFMIPSTISLPNLHDESDWPSLDVASTARAHERSVRLDCRGCAFPVDGEKDVWSADIPSSLVFDFATSADSKSVLVNGERIFPLDHAVQLKAAQIASDVSAADYDAAPAKFLSVSRQLDFALSSRVVEAADGTDEQLVDIDLRVFGTDGSAKPLDTLAIRILRDDRGRVTIASVDCVRNEQGLAAYNAMSAADRDLAIQLSLLNDHGHRRPRPKHAICQGAGAVMCDWIQMIESKLASAGERLSQQQRGPSRKRPCPGRLGRPAGRGPYGVPTSGGIPKYIKWKHHPKMLPFEDAELRDTMVHHGKDGHGLRHHEHPHRHARHGKVFEILQGLDFAINFIFFSILVPLFIGGCVGLFIGFVGALVGGLISWAWINLVRGGRRGNQSRVSAEQADVVRAAPQEKAALLVEASDEEAEVAPPVYAEK